MAYKNLVAQVCADKTEYFCRLRDYICQRAGTYDYSVTGIGWTLHDSSYAVDENNPEDGDWFVMTSLGEGGDDALFVQVVWGVNVIGVKGYLYWNNSTHLGTALYGSINNLTILDAAGSYDIYVYGDLDFFQCWETLRDASYDRSAFFGKAIDSPFDSTIATSSAAITAATPATITLDAVPASWVVGGSVVIRNLAVIERVEILTIVGSDITANVSNSYASGAILQEECTHVCSSSAADMSAAVMASHAPPGAVTSTSGSASFPGFVAGNLDPDALYDDYILGKYTITAAGTIVGRLPNVFYGGTSSLTEKDVLTDGASSYRYLRKYSSSNCFMLEV